MQPQQPRLGAPGGEGRGDVAQRLRQRVGHQGRLRSGMAGGARRLVHRLPDGERCRIRRAGRRRERHTVLRGPVDAQRRRLVVGHAGVVPQHPFEGRRRHDLDGAEGKAAHHDAQDEDDEEGISPAGRRQASPCGAAPHRAQREAKEDQAAQQVPQPEPRVDGRHVAGRQPDRDDVPERVQDAQPRETDEEQEVRCPADRFPCPEAALGKDVEEESCGSPPGAFPEGGAPKACQQGPGAFARRRRDDGQAESQPASGAPQAPRHGDRGRQGDSPAEARHDRPRAR
jgi:hypothetical protein